MSVQISRTSSESILTVDTSELVAGATYDLVIESYDENSSVKSALKTDTIQLIVPEPVLVSEAVPVSEPIIQPSFKSEL